MVNVLLVLFFLPFGFAEFKDDCLKAHNKYRKIHDAPDLVLDDSLQQSAQSYANEDKGMIHSPGSQRGKYGENIYMSGGTSPNAEAAVKMWYDEIKDYSFEKATYTKGTGHFTQVVWKSSKNLGCAFIQKGSKVYVVAQYTPPGNLIGAFKENVLKGSYSQAVTIELSKLIVFGVSTIFWALFRR